MPTARAWHIALVGETEHDVREVMIEGPSGLLRVSPRGERPVWMASRRRLEWPNGAVGTRFPPRIPSSLRGPQFDAAWCDELAKWRHAEATFDMLQFGLRLGAAAAPAHHHDAAADPADQAADRRSAHRGDARRHAGQRRASVAGVSRRGAGALCRHAARPPGNRRRDHRGPRRRAVVARHDRSARAFARRRRCGASSSAIDPPASTAHGADACGIVAAGLAEDGVVYVLADASVQGLQPRRLGRQARSRFSPAARPTRWSPRSTRAATWCARCCAQVEPACR